MSRKEETPTTDNGPEQAPQPGDLILGVQYDFGQGASLLDSVYESLEPYMQMGPDPTYQSLWESCVQRQALELDARIRNRWAGLGEASLYPVIKPAGPERR